MASTGRHNGRPIAAATMSAGDTDVTPDVLDGMSTSMPYACQTCTRRKVKCDKGAPTCSTCQKGRLECFYQAPAPRKRKRQMSGDANDRLQRYERILQEHGLLDEADATTPELQKPPVPQTTPVDSEDRMAKLGKLVSAPGKTRYINSTLWRHLGEEELQQLSEYEDRGESAGAAFVTTITDPVTGVMLGVASQDLFSCHPTFDDALKLWQIYLRNGEPIIKAFHVPTVTKLLTEGARDTRMSAKSTECLLFSIYHFAVFSSTDEECIRDFGEQRATLVSRYESATRQALVNASFMKTTEMPVLQAYMLYLASMRQRLDPNIFWIQTGILLRIAQRMGLHRDAETLGLSPYEVQMRRRVFWNVLPLDGMAGQHCGTGVALGSQTWDTKPPLNVNDDQIWPGMTEPPTEQKGASDMMFCLARVEMGRFHTRAKASLFGVSTFWEDESPEEIDRVINELENTMESKYVRYCDPVEPVQFLTLMMTRGIVTISKLRIRMLRLRKSKGEGKCPVRQREACLMALKLLDYDNSIHSNKNLARFAWHTRVTLQWDTIIYLLSTMRQPGVLSKTEIEETWSKMDAMLEARPDFLSPKMAMHVAISRLALKAWDAEQLSSDIAARPERVFVQKMRNLLALVAHNNAATILVGQGSDTFSGAGQNGFENGLDGPGAALEMDLDLGTPDWVQWDKLIQDYQAASGMPTYPTDGSKQAPGPFATPQYTPHG